MIGCTAQNNDVFLYFEGDEIDRLSRETIKGHYVNLRNPEVVGDLEISVEDMSGEIIKTTGEKNERGLFIKYQVKIRGRAYGAFRERRNYGLHEGFRHVNFIDAQSSELNLGERRLYGELCRARTKSQT